MSSELGDYPRDIVITRVEQVTLKVDQPRIGVNSRSREMVYPEADAKWDEPILRIHMSDGTVGWGAGRGGTELAHRALNRSPFDLLDPAAGVLDEFVPLENALWDAVGKVLGKPVYELIADPAGPSVGAVGREWVPAYDSTIYFNDLLHDTREAGLKRIVRDVEASLDRGFRAFKMKIGRGNHLMVRAEGMLRDVEVVKLARQTAGDDIDIIVDANDAYTCEEAIEFLNAVGHLGVFWVEEMFEEQVEEYGKLKGFINANGWHTLTADGETRSREPIDFFQPFFRAGVLDVVQHDIRMLGLTGWRRLARVAGQHDVSCAPHNWGSLLGLYLSLQLGKVIPHFLYAEVATLSSDVIDASGYTFENGAFNVPDAPGLGLELIQNSYARHYTGRGHWCVESEAHRS